MQGFCQGIHGHVVSNIQRINYLLRQMSVQQVPDWTVDEVAAEEGVQTEKRTL